MDHVKTEGMQPSEKAKVYKKLYTDMKMAGEVIFGEAPKKGRPHKADKASKDKRKIRLDEEMALSVGESRNQLHRYLGLAEVLRNCRIWWTENGSPCLRRWISAT